MSGPNGGTHGFPVADSAWPVLGHAHGIFRDLRRFVARAEARHGPVFWTHFGFGRWALTCTHPDSLLFLKNKATTSTHYQERAGVLLGDSVIVHDGAKHQHLRSALNGPFTHKGLSSQAVGPVIAETIEKRVRSWGTNRDLRILALTRELALDVIFRMIGIQELDLPAWRRHYETFLLTGLHIPIDIPGTPRWFGLRAKRWLDGRMLAAVRKARRDPESSGFIGQLVRSKDDAGEALSDIDLVENLRLLSLAGHETSATSMAWLMLELARSPAHWDRLVEEARANALPRTPKELGAFPFAEALFREVVRLHPPVPFNSRLTIEPLEIHGHQVPAGIEIALILDRISRHESLYERPASFAPERWINKKDGISALELVQFGGGPHFCLGYHVAWMELVQFAVAMARAASEQDVRPVLRGPWPATRFVPLAHPSKRARIGFERR